MDGMDLTFVVVSGVMTVGSDQGRIRAAGGLVGMASVFRMLMRIAGSHWAKFLLEKLWRLSADQDFRFNSAKSHTRARVRVAVRSEMPGKSAASTFGRPARKRSLMSSAPNVLRLR